MQSIDFLSRVRIRVCCVCVFRYATSIVSNSTLAAVVTAHLCATKSKSWRMPGKERETRTSIRNHNINDASSHSALADKRIHRYTYNVKYQINPVQSSSLSSHTVYICMFLTLLLLPSLPRRHLFISSASCNLAHLAKRGRAWEGGVEEGPSFRYVCVSGIKVGGWVSLRWAKGH